MLIFSPKRKVDLVRKRLRPDLKGGEGEEGGSRRINHLYDLSRKSTSKRRVREHGGAFLNHILLLAQRQRTNN